MILITLIYLINMMNLIINLFVFSGIMKIIGNNDTKVFQIILIIPKGILEKNEQTSRVGALEPTAGTYPGLLLAILNYSRLF